MSELRVVIVDDDFHVARLHTRIVEATGGYTVVATAGSIAEARTAIEAARPELLLADIYLPDGSGLDLVRGYDLDAIVLSAAVTAAAVRTSFQRGAFAYLVKPFADEALAEVLRGYTRYRNLLDAQPELDQETIDRARRVLHGSATRDAAARRSPTEQSVLEALAQSPDALSAPVVAAQLGISRATAQRYLSALAHDGQLLVELRYGSTGRPEHRYRLPR
ncbi:response regulator [Herbiconiux flava]|uniref:Transcriptional regulatory protein n=1 Tax=Herbiconiux flava TaxID=881268 RepID=A0A852SKT7_9MICO|nr:response regulator [Herbiconiux flava]NYD69745.1 two-component system CitB family response regulator [Herbiconiux flava]GLK16493.1 transcriptional regulatory protein [Herbiconiux flava]